jgi:hypothetical protein
MINLKEYYNLRRKILINLISGGSVLVMVIVTSSLYRCNRIKPSYLRDRISNFQYLERDQ